VRIEKLNDNKIKVTLTTMDLVNLDIDIKQLAPDSKELHAFLFHIMETIRLETGFNPYSGQVMVEATPSRDGISILVSKLKNNSKRITKAQFNSAKGVKAKLKTEDKTEIFYFENFDDLCAALAASPRDSLHCGALYKLGDTYCFVIKDGKQNRKCLAVMSEFAPKRSKYPMQLAYIREHGTLVSKGAALAQMADEIENLL
jgi:adapter protein MecA 1/2